MNLLRKIVEGDRVVVEKKLNHYIYVLATIPKDG